MRKAQNHISRGFLLLVRRLAIAMILVSIHPGCSDANRAGVAVSGKVTVDGQPLGRGTITFSTSNPGAPVVVGDIIYGEYLLKAHEGPWPGEQSVQILAFKEKSTDSSVAPATIQQTTVASAKQKATPLVEVEQYLPARFNSETTLKVTLNPGTNRNINLSLVTEPPK